MNRLTGLSLICCFAGSVSAGASECPQLDSFRRFEELIEKTRALTVDEQVAQLERSFVSKHPELYRAEVIGIAPGERLDRLLRAELLDTSAQTAWPATHAALKVAIPRVSLAFQQSFKDFRCDFPIYLTASLGMLDGAGRLVSGKPALVLGVDSIAMLEAPAQLPVFLSHELFHRYHFAAAGFSDDPGEHQEIWRVLWAEGLATYVSATLNPDRPLTDAWLLPKDLEERALPVMASLIKDATISLDRIDAATYARLFLYNDKDAAARGWPPRAGYYLGYRLAKELAPGRSLDQLAHLGGESLHLEIATALKRLESAAQ
jgi:Predicted Zn-dependent protease (DUF2268)